MLCHDFFVHIDILDYFYDATISFAGYNHTMEHVRLISKKETQVFGKMILIKHVNLNISSAHLSRHLIFWSISEKTVI